MRVLKLLVVTAFAFFAIASCSSNESAGPSSPEAPATPEAPAAPSPEAAPDELAVGEGKYKEYCSKCHKEDGTGGKVEIAGRTINAENLTTEKMKGEPDEEYIEYMVKGIPDEGMPSFKGEISDDEMKAVVRYIREKLQK